MRTLIVGCGYLGTRLGRALVEAGHEVSGVRRDATALSGTGIHPVAADLLDPASLAALPQAELVVACQAPRRGEGYKGTYYDGTRNLVAALRARPPRRLVLVSSTSVYSTSDGSWVDERTPPLAAPPASKEASDDAHFLLGAEKAALTAGFPAVVLRLGGLYGPGRHRLKALKEGSFAPSFSERTFVNRIRVEDAVAAVIAVAEKGEAGGVYLGVDDAPSTQAEFYGWLFERLDLPRPADAPLPPPHASNKRCSNAKLRALGWAPRFPSFREGYAELLYEMEGKG